MALLQSLRHRSFAWLWGGQTISVLGDHLYQVALAWWVLEKTGSATAMGTVLIFSFAPMLLFLLIGGVAVDRFSRARLMIFSDLVRGVLVGLVALLAYNQQLELWHAYVASISFGLVDAFFQPAYTALVPEVAPREVLPSANSLSSMSRKLMGILGPALGAYLIRMGGTPLAFALDSASFFVSAMFLLPLLRFGAPSQSEARPKQGVLHEVREGIRTVFASPWLWITIVVAALANITQGGPFSVALPLLVKERLQDDVGALGLILSFFSLGSFTGALWMGRLSRIRHRGLLAYGAWAVGGLATLAMGLPLGLLGVALSALVVGVTLSIFGLVWTNTIQELVPRELLGRVSSVDYLGSYALLPIGYGLAGIGADHLGASTIFLLGGALTTALILLGLAHPAVRALD
jgi:MFS family permease